MIYSRAAWVGNALHRQRRSFSTTCRRFKDPFEILFCGSDRFSIGSLRAVLEAKDVWSNIHVITPDIQRIGRGGRNTKRLKEAYKCDLLTFAEDKGLNHSTLSSVIGAHDDRARDPIWQAPPPFDSLASTNLLLTASFGHIIPNNLLEKFHPAHRLNVHPSLLPKYRGAAPIQWTILNGDQTTGISVQRLVERGKGIDAGEIVGSVSEILVAHDATFSSMIDELAPKGGQLLVQCLRDILSGKHEATPQDSTLKTRAPKITKETSRIDWTRDSAVQIDRMQRAISHQYPLWTETRGQIIQLIEVSPFDKTMARDTLERLLPATTSDCTTGTAILDRSAAGRSRRLIVACRAYNDADVGGVSWLEVTKVKPEGKKQMDVKDWWNGLPDQDRMQGWTRL